MSETDNCSSWISWRERMTIENISWLISTKECCETMVGLHSLLITSLTRIWLSHRGRQNPKMLYTKGTDKMQTMLTQITQLLKEQSDQGPKNMAKVFEIFGHFSIYSLAMPNALWWMNSNKHCRPETACIPQCTFYNLLYRNYNFQWLYKSQHIRKGTFSFLGLQMRISSPLFGLQTCLFFLKLSQGPY